MFSKKQKSENGHVPHSQKEKKNPIILQRQGLNSNAMQRDSEGKIIQMKTQLGSVSDASEQEADTIADQVVNKGANRSGIQNSEEEAVQMKPISKQISPVQSKFNEARPVDSKFESQLNQERGNGSEIGAETRGEMESGFGADFKKVRIHTDKKANDMSQSINARAFTTGNDIYFNSGEYKPESVEGKKLLAHELTHTVQQAGLSTNTVQRSHDEDEFKIYVKYRLELFDREIAKATDAKVIAKLKKDKEKFEKKSESFSEKMTNKDGWGSDNFEKKRTNKFKEDYKETIDKKRSEVKEEVAASVVSTISRITIATDLMSEAIVRANEKAGKAESLLQDAKKVLLEAKDASRIVAATHNKEDDDSKTLDGLSKIIERSIELVETIQNNKDDLLSDKPRFTAVIADLNNQQFVLDAFGKQVEEQNDVVILVDLQESKLPELEVQINNSIATANATKPSAELVNENSINESIENLSSDTQKQLQEPGIAEKIKDLKNDHGAEANWPLSVKIKRDLKSWTDQDRFKLVVTSIRSASVAERQKALKDGHVLNAITASLGEIEAASVVSELLVGSQDWKNPADNDFYTHFVANKKSGLLKTNKTMNCWESILYAAHISGHLEAKWIENFYLKAGVIPGVHYDADASVKKVWKQLGFDFGLPKYNPVAGSVPKLGQLVFYVTPGSKIPAHVAISVGNGEVISIWTQPNGIDKVQRIPVYSFPGRQVYFGDAPWN